MSASPPSLVPGPVSDSSSSPYPQNATWNHRKVDIISGVACILTIAALVLAPLTHGISLIALPIIWGSVNYAHKIHKNTVTANDSSPQFYEKLQNTLWHETNPYKAGKNYLNELVSTFQNPETKQEFGIKLASKVVKYAESLSECDRWKLERMGNASEEVKMAAKSSIDVLLKNEIINESTQPSDIFTYIHHANGANPLTRRTYE